MNIKTIIYRLLFAAIAIAAATPAATGSEPSVPFDTISARLDYQRYVFPQEKIHVTTDQGRYVTGDTIWLRAWVTDAASGHQVNASKYVYVELLSPFGKVEKRIKIREDNGLYSGYLDLDEELPEGNYTLAAYTTFMEGLGTDYFFRKPLGVISPYSTQAEIVTTFEPTDNDESLKMSLSFQDREGKPLHYETMYVTSSTEKQMEGGRGTRTRNFTLKRKDFPERVALVQLDHYKKYIVLPPKEGLLDVTFHPEGGYLIPGVPCKVGFKAIDGAGAGVDVTGVITTSRGDTVANLQTIHKGIGSVMILPVEDEHYTAHINGHTFELPATNAEAAVIHADNSKGDYLDITPVGNVPDGAMVVVQSHGVARYAAPAENGKTYRVPATELGDGVVQILLMTADMQPLSERLIFNYPAHDTILSVTRR